MPLLKFELIASDEGQARQMPDQQIVAISRFENGMQKWSEFESTLLLPGTKRQKHDGPGKCQGHRLSVTTWRNDVLQRSAARTGVWRLRLCLRLLPLPLIF
ncbi:hypothetical protein, partial [Xanthomonas fragariae]|uniref:hypothetical protein n=1 Tax=Xanthomonas fragariae TaxID=48664 RepID=UPI003530E3C1